MFKVLSAAALVAADATTYPAVMGYKPTSDVQSILKLGEEVEALDAAVAGDERDWTLGNTVYERETNGMSLRAVLPAGEACADDCRHFKAAAAYYGSEDYMHEFVSDALKGEGIAADLSGAIGEKMREELTMKGVVLQGMLMASISSLQQAATACTESKPDLTTELLDKSWAMYASSEGKGPIKLAEKRAPQFAVEHSHPTEAGDSYVNVKLLELFKALQLDAQSMLCTTMKTKIDKIIALMQVPVIQGLLREAYEVDPRNHEETRGADGFVEVAEGWAFTRAVLPAIHTCSAEAATKIKKNMDTIALGAEGEHMPDGFVAVKAAVESTYPCLGISCADVNAMVTPWKTDELLWQPCTDEANSAKDATATQQAVQASGEDASGTELATTLGSLSAVAVVFASCAY